MGITMLQITEQEKDKLYEEGSIDCRNWENPLFEHTREPTEYAVDDIMNGVEMYENKPVILKYKQFELPTVYKERKLVLLDRDVIHGGIESKNVEQTIAMNYLADEDIECVAITGRPRSGKTLIASDYAISSVKTDDFQRLVLTRPNVELGNPLGHLPGEVEDKFDEPFLQPIYDCAERLGDRRLIDDMKSNDEIETVPIPFIKGRNFRDSIIMVDEAEDLTIEELQIIGTRLDKGSRIILTGDIKQVDNRKIRGKIPPFEYMVNKFKGYGNFAHIHFTESQGMKIVDMFYDLLDRSDF